MLVKKRHMCLETQSSSRITAASPAPCDIATSIQPGREPQGMTAGGGGPRRGRRSSRQMKVEPAQLQRRWLRLQPRWQCRWRFSGSGHCTR